MKTNRNKWKWKTDWPTFTENTKKLMKSLTGKRLKMLKILKNFPMVLENNPYGKFKN